MTAETLTAAQVRQALQSPQLADKLGDNPDSSVFLDDEESRTRRSLVAKLRALNVGSGFKLATQGGVDTDTTHTVDLTKAEQALLAKVLA